MMKRAGDCSDPRLSYAKAYSFALKSEPKRLHFAAHSHHPWPDCTRDAQMAYWEDSALADEKWDRIFGKVAETRKHISRMLGGVDPTQIALAPNTHEFVVRLLSCFRPSDHIRILTTDSEFHSFARQVRRLEEDLHVQVDRISVEPFETFPERWAVAAAMAKYDVAFISHVFFNSGFALDDLKSMVEPFQAEKTLVVIDGYHGFGALPISLGGLEKRVFYTAGGYKYAQSGEGVCFLYVPTDCSLRPANTGWFSDYENLESVRAQGPVGYGGGGARFAGSTMDFTAAYRFNAVQNWWRKEGITVDKIHRRVTKLKQAFVEGLEKSGSKAFPLSAVIRANGKLPVGHFITFRTPDAKKLAEKLIKKRIIVDYRGDRLRFGFGLYHDLKSVDLLLKALRTG